MNDKLPEIGTLVAALRERFGVGNIELSSNWDDPAAVGISVPVRPGRLAYICWYPTGYFVALEFPPPTASDLPYAEGGDHHDLSMEDTIGLVGTHLGLAGPR